MSEQQYVTVKIPLDMAMKMDRLAKWAGSDIDSMVEEAINYANQNLAPDIVEMMEKADD